MDDPTLPLPGLSPVNVEVRFDCGLLSSDGACWRCAPARVLEIISPAGFESCFRELGAELAGGALGPRKLAAQWARSGVDMDMGSILGLIRRFGVRFPGAPFPTFGEPA